MDTARNANSVKCIEYFFILFYKFFIKRFENIKSRRIFVSTKETRSFTYKNLIP